jgi:hypothetical protein
VLPHEPTVGFVALTDSRIVATNSLSLESSFLIFLGVLVRIHEKGTCEMQSRADPSSSASQAVFHCVDSYATDFCRGAAASMGAKLSKAAVKHERAEDSFLHFADASPRSLTRLPSEKPVYHDFAAISKGIEDGDIMNLWI